MTRVAILDLQRERLLDLNTPMVPMRSDLKDLEPHFVALLNLTDELVTDWGHVIQEKETRRNAERGVGRVHA
jgi:hypothetical protein